MKLVLRKNNTADSSRNPYLADSVSTVVPHPIYEIQTQPSAVCQTSVNTSIGENAITGYTYSWNPTTYLSGSSTPVSFTYDYASKPVYNDTILQYLVEITRPNGCRTTDTVFVPLKMLPFVDAVSDQAICHGGTLNINFTDVHNTGSTYAWTASSNTVGMSAQGTGNHITQTLSNVGASSATVTITVTPKKNGCDGVSKQFTVTVHPLPDFVSVADTTVCTAITLSDLISNLPVNSEVMFYSDAAGTSLLPSAQVGILSDTLYYVRIVDTITGCESVMHTINIHQGSYPDYVPTTGPNIVCIGAAISLSNAAQEGGVWSVSDPAIVEIVNSTSNSVEIEGRSEGKVFVSYTTGTGNSQTKAAFGVKVLPQTPPNIIIGVER
jgi:hypothetical protein